jgi:stress response protein YsnF
MAYTVVGLFENESEAQRAVERLESTGISRQNVDYTRGSGSTENTSSSRDSDDSGVTRFFKSLFGSDDDADRYSRVSNQGCYIVTVHAQSNDQAEQAADVLDDCGAIDVDERSSSGGYGAVSNSNTEDRSSLTGNRSETTIPRIEENLEVGKRTEERGGVRVRSRIVEKPVEEHIRLRSEEVHVERQAVNRPISDADANNLRDRDIELTERTEVPVINKEARVVEEIRLSKEVNERNETVRDTVRNTEIDVDRLDQNERRDMTDEGRSSSI